MDLSLWVKKNSDDFLKEPRTGQRMVEMNDLRGKIRNESSYLRNLSYEESIFPLITIKQLHVIIYKNYVINATRRESESSFRPLTDIFIEI